MGALSLHYSLFTYNFLIILFVLFLNLNGTITKNKNERFSLKVRRGQVIFDETEGQVLPNDYEFLLSPDAEDDVPNRIYEDVFPDLPPHDYVLRGKYMGQVESKFVTPQPITTKFPHTPPPFDIPESFKNDKERFIWLSSLHDTLFPDDNKKKSHNKNNTKIEHNVPLKIKSGGQERNESKLLIQQVTTNLNITNIVEEKNNINKPLKSKNLTNAVNEIIENNKKIGVDMLTNDYNDNIEFNEALKLAEAEAKRVLEEHKRRDEETRIREEEDNRVIENIKNHKNQLTMPESFSKEQNSTNPQLINNNEISISTSTKGSVVKIETNINDILLNKLADLTTTTVKPLTTKSFLTTATPSNKNVSENKNNQSINEDKKIRNNKTLSTKVFEKINKVETTTIQVVGNTMSSVKSFQFVRTTTKNSLTSNFKCPILNAYRDGKPHPNTSKFCQTFIPEVSNDNTCKCRYFVGSRDSNNCPSSFLYICKPSIGK